jgi:hypothetical protein
MRAAVAAALSLSAAHVAGYTATPMVRPAAVQSQAPRVAAAIRMEAVAKSEEECAMVPAELQENCGPGARTSAPFKKVMAANRAEIAVRIMRACTELNMETVAIYGYEDRYSQHRWGAEQSFMLEKEATASPISAYLDIDQIINIAKENEVRPSCRSAPPEIAARGPLEGPQPEARASIAAFRASLGEHSPCGPRERDRVLPRGLPSQVEAIHPGYGFLSESPEFAQVCAGRCAACPCEAGLPRGPASAHPWRSR